MWPLMLCQTESMRLVSNKIVNESHNSHNPTRFVPQTSTPLHNHPMRPYPYRCHHSDRLCSFQSSCPSSSPLPDAIRTVPPPVCTAESRVPPPDSATTWPHRRWTHNCGSSTLDCRSHRTTDRSIARSVSWPHCAWSHHRRRLPRHHFRPHSCDGGDRSTWTRHDHLNVSVMCWVGCWCLRSACWTRPENCLLAVMHL